MNCSKLRRLRDLSRNLHGTQRNTVDRLWKDLGGTVRSGNRNGHSVYEHPLVGRFEVNRRDKNAQRCLTAAIRKLLTIIL